ncbi:MAG: helix-turn-helix transcriptional regulator [Oscillospiraceae bacterium]|nr:helix-turn-helix transcriptional regulator [Oscillospiraceae bacterium]
MIVYDKLWSTMKAKGFSQYKLIKEYDISSSQLDRLRKNSNVNTYTLNRLCNILDCQLDDIAQFVKDEESQPNG